MTTVHFHTECGDTRLGLWRHRADTVPSQAQGAVLGHVPILPSDGPSGSLSSSPAWPPLCPPWARVQRSLGDTPLGMCSALSSLPDPRHVSPRCRGGGRFGNATRFPPLGPALVPVHGAPGGRGKGRGRGGRGGRGVKHVVTERTPNRGRRTHRVHIYMPYRGGVRLQLTGFHQPVSSWNK